MVSCLRVRVCGVAVASSKTRWPLNKGGVLHLIPWIPKWWWLHLKTNLCHTSCMQVSSLSIVQYRARLAAWVWARNWSLSSEAADYSVAAWVDFYTKNLRAPEVCMKRISELKSTPIFASLRPGLWQLTTGNSMCVLRLFMCSVTKNWIPQAAWHEQAGTTTPDDSLRSAAKHQQPNHNSCKLILRSRAWSIIIKTQKQDRIDSPRARQTGHHHSCRRDNSFSLDACCEDTTRRFDGPGLIATRARMSQHRRHANNQTWWQKDYNDRGKRIKHHGQLEDMEHGVDEDASIKQPAMATNCHATGACFARTIARHATSWRQQKSVKSLEGCWSFAREQGIRARYARVWVKTCQSIQRGCKYQGASLSSQHCMVAVTYEPVKMLTRIQHMLHLKDRDSNSIVPLWFWVRWWSSHGDRS